MFQMAQIDDTYNDTYMDKNLEIIVFPKFKSNSYQRPTNTPYFKLCYWTMNSSAKRSFYCKFSARGANQMKTVDFQPRLERPEIVAVLGWNRKRGVSRKDKSISKQKHSLFAFLLGASYMQTTIEVAFSSLDVEIWFCSIFWTSALKDVRANFPTLIFFSETCATVRWWVSYVWYIKKWRVTDFVLERTCQEV